MNAHPADDRLIGYALGELDEEAAGDVRRHLSACPRCRGEVRWIESLGASLSSLPTLSPRERVWSAILSSSGRGRFPARSTVAWRLAVGTAAVAVVAFLVIRFRRDEGAPPPPRVGVAEMGSRIGKEGLDRQDPREAMETFFSDAAAILSDAYRCADSENAAAWSAIKERIASRGMLYRAYYLRRLLARTAGRGGTGASAEVDLLRDTAAILRLITDRSAEELSADGRPVKRAIARTSLLDRLGKEQNR